VQNLKDPKTSVRVQAAAGLGPLCQGDVAAAKVAVPALVEALADYDTYVRRKAAESLGQCGVLAKDAAPALRRAAQENRDRDVVKATQEALRRITE
jgi:HEAT repeat protein